MLRDGAGALKERMRVMYDGRVGLGTSGPQALLHVSGSGSTGPAMRIDGFADGRINLVLDDSQANAITGLHVVTSDAGSLKGGFLLSTAKGTSRHLSSAADYDTYLATRYRTSLLLGVNAAEKMRIDEGSGGNVGIWTTSPGSALQVGGNVSIGYASSATAPANGLSVAGSVGVGLPSGVAPPCGKLYVSGADALGRAACVGYDATQNSNVEFLASSDTSVGAAIQLRDASGTSRVRIAAGTGDGYLAGGGRLGLGTTTPTAGLHLASNRNVQAGDFLVSHRDAGAVPLNANASEAAAFRTDGASPGASTWVQLSLGGSQSQGAYALDATKLTAGSGSPASLLLNPSGGPVGIGTATPSGTLQVAGPTRTHDGLTFVVYTTATDSTGKKLVAKWTGATDRKYRFWVDDSTATDTTWMVMYRDGSYTYTDPTSVTPSLYGLGPDEAHALVSSSDSGTLFLKSDFKDLDTNLRTKVASFQFADCATCTPVVRFEYNNVYPMLFGNYLRGVAAKVRGGQGEIVSSDGNVGIGTVGAPPHRLYVEGNTAVSGGNRMIARYSSADDTYAGSLSWSGLQLGNNGGNFIAAGRTQAGGSLHFFTNNTNDPTYFAGGTAPNGILALSLSADGKTGLQTQSPRARLDLGTISDGIGLVVNPGTTQRSGPAYSSSLYHNDVILGTWLNSSGYGEGYLSFGYVQDAQRKFHIGTASAANFSDPATGFLPGLTVTSGRSVGIATPSPETGTRLDVYSEGADPKTLLQVRANRTGYGNVRARFEVYAGGSAAADRLAIGAGETYPQTLAVLANGRVGVGTTAPAFKLDVVDEGTGNATMRLASSGSQSTTLRLDTYNDAGKESLNRNWALRNRYNDYGILELMRSADSTSNPLTTVQTWYRDGSVRFNGYVGVQTNATEGALHVLGAVVSEGTAGSGRLVLKSTRADGGHQYDWYVDNPYVGDMSLYDRTAGRTDIAFKPDGKVGIGVDSPTEKLDVNGNVRARGSFVADGSVSGWNTMKQIWYTGTAGTYTLQYIFDVAKGSGTVTVGTYDCVMRTNNGAHWTGRRFTTTVNYYSTYSGYGYPVHAGYPHRYYNVVDIDAGSGGCGPGIQSFDANPPGTISFIPGACYQTLYLYCMYLF